MKNHLQDPVIEASLNNVTGTRPARRSLKRRGPAPLVLEQRIMFDGAMADAVIKAAANGAATEGTIAEKAVVEKAATAVPAAVLSPASGNTADRHEIVFIEDNVADFQKLAADVREGVEVVVLDHTRDGLQQMVDALKDSAPLDAIHLISHGASGQIELGAVSLSNSNIENYREPLTALKQALTQDADFLIYGCDVAGTPAGQSLISTLSDITGADVAASTNTTGGTAYGGDWVLEANTGPIETTVFDGGADYGSRLTTVNLSSASSTWVPVLNGSIFDPGQDLQAQSAIDLVGNSSNTLLYMKYDNGADNINGTADDEIAFRVRVDQTTDNKGVYNGYTWMGIDVDRDNDLDVFVMAFMNSSKQFTLNTYQAGSGAQTSPSTTSLDSQHPTALAGASYSLNLVTAVDSGGTADVDSDGNNDYFLSFKINASTFFSNINGKTLTGQGTTISGINKDTSLQFVLATAQNENALNGDIGGYGSGDSNSTTYASKGVFVQTSFGDPASATVAASDTTSPTVAITSDKASLKSGDTAGLTFTFSEDVGSSFTAADVSLESGSLSNFTKIDSTHYTATYTPLISTTDSSMQIDIGVSKFTDTASTPNANTAAATLSLDIDTQAPLISGPSGLAGDAVAAKTINENTTAVHTFTANEAISWSIVGGEDQAKFQIDASGNLSFLNAPDYENPTDGGTSGSNTYIVQIQALDTVGNAADQTVTVSIADVNENGADSTLPTVTAGQSFDYQENRPQNASVGTVAATDDTGVTGFRFTDTGTATSNDGYFTIGSNGSITITAAGVVAGVAQNDYEKTPNSFVYAVQARDAAGNWSASQNVSLNVTNSDEVAPAFTSTSTGSVAENQNALYIAQATDTVDFTDHVVTYSLKPAVGDAAGLSINASTGAVTLSSGNLDHETKSSYNFTIIASDASNNTREQAVTITVTNVNEAPTASATSITTSEDTAKSASLPAATDVDGDTVTYAKASDPTHGTVTVNTDGSYTYTPTANYNGADSFAYTVSDGNGGSNTYTVGITVGAANSAPTASGTSITINEDTTKSASLPTATDVDGDTVTYAKASDPSNGIVTVNTDGSYTYTPTANYNGADSFTYTVSDGKGGSNTYTVGITVGAVNDAPTASGTSITTSEDTAKSASLPAATDVDGDTVTYAKASDPTHGTVTVNTDGSYTYTPTANYNGADSFAYTVSDGNGGSNTYTVGITVGAVNDAPTASGTSITINEDTTKSASLPTATDVDGDTVTYAKASDPTHGTVTINTDGSYTYTPTANYNGADSFTYTVSDGKGGSNTYTVDIMVAPVNDAPVASTAASGTGIVGEPITPLAVPAFTDVDNPTLTYSAKLADGSALPAWLSFDPATRTFTGTPPANTDGSYALKVTGSDGALTDSVSITLTVQNPSVPGQTVTIASMTKDTGVSPSDFITADGSANRTVTGSLDAILGHNEVVQVSFDGGATWNTATTAGTNWRIVDNSAHGADWTITARVTNIVANQSGSAANQNVTLDTTPPAIPTVDTISTASTTPILSGTAALGDGETLRVTVNGATYDVMPHEGKWTLDLANTSPATGTLAPIIAGNSYDVTATVIDTAGNAVSDGTSLELNISVPQTPLAPAPTPVPQIIPAPAAVDSLPPPLAAPLPVVESRSVDSAPVAPGGIVGSDTARVGYGQGTLATESTLPLTIRDNAGLSDVYTRSEGFRTVVAKADVPALVLFQGVPDQYTESGTHLSLTVPADAFAHTQPKATVRLAATLQDGRPLPEWVQFNGQTGQFSGDVPKGLVGELRIKLIARDMAGREATALFRINVGDLRGTVGKSSLSEQLRRSGMPHHARHSPPAQHAGATAPAKPAPGPRQ